MKIKTAGKLGTEAEHLSFKQLGETNQLDVHAQDGLGVSPTARQRATPTPQVPQMCGYKLGAHQGMP